jgi:hypothetical protein
MSETFVTGYQRLFEIRILHHYWLDDGATPFDLMASAEQKLRRITDYDRRAFLEITATATTVSVLKGAHGIYKDTAQGCIVAVPRTVSLPNDTELEFLIKVHSPAFFNYTALTLQSRKVYYLSKPGEAKTYRFKENVPVFSNRTGASRGVGLDKALFLSKEIPAVAADDRVESLVADNNSLLQLTGDQPGAATRELDAAITHLPVFANQSDVPTLVPPAGLQGVPPRGISLSPDIDDAVFAVIRLSAIRADDGDFSFLDNQGHAKPTAPVFQIRFKNRSTIWKYLDKNTGVLKSSEPNPLPLTHFGNAGTKQKASSDRVKVRKNGNQIDQLESEVLI